MCSRVIGLNVIYGARVDIDGVKQWDVAPDDAVGGRPQDPTRMGPCNRRPVPQPSCRVC